MISFLRGRLVQRDEQGVTIEVAGIGYRLLMSTHSLTTLGELDSHVMAYTLLQIRDDAPVLYGFISMEEKQLFERLVSVTGVGPKVALSALSSFAATELAAIIADGDVTRIASTPGIGKKTAQRIVLELKGILELEQSDTTSRPMVDAGHTEATGALLSMGFTTSEIQAALKGYEGATDTSALLRYALKRLGG